MREFLGEMTAFGLEVLVVSDILETLVKGIVSSHINTKSFTERLLSPLHLLNRRC